MCVHCGQRPVEFSYRRFSIRLWCIPRINDEKKRIENQCYVKLLNINIVLVQRYTQFVYARITFYNYFNYLTFFFFISSIIVTYTHFRLSVCVCVCALITRFTFLVNTTVLFYHYFIITCRSILPGTNFLVDFSFFISISSLERFHARVSNY